MHLSVEGLSVRYGAVRALEDVSFRVEGAETVCLVGANGAGKSSTINSIMGFVRPYKGRIVLDGDDLTACSVRDRARRGLAIVPEGRHVFPGLSVAENLQVGASRLHSRAERGNFDAVFSIFPALARLRKRSAWSLSGGEQQMLVIGRALMLRPVLLLMDEPSLGLAPLLVREVLDAVVRIRASGVGIVLVEQNTKLALKLADRALVLNAGRAVAQGSPDDLAADTLERAYLGERQS